MIAKLCIQCKDRVSGKLGTFLSEKRDGFYAISPVFSDILDCYTWAKENGFYEVSPHSLMSDYSNEA